MLVDCRKCQGNKHWFNEAFMNTGKLCLFMLKTIMIVISFYLLPYPLLQTYNKYETYLKKSRTVLVYLSIYGACGKVDEYKTHDLKIVFRVPLPPICCALLICKALCLSCPSTQMWTGSCLGYRSLSAAQRYAMIWVCVVDS